MKLGHSVSDHLIRRSSSCWYRHQTTPTISGDSGDSPRADSSHFHLARGGEISILEITMDHHQSCCFVCGDRNLELEVHLQVGSNARDIWLRRDGVFSAQPSYHTTRPKKLDPSIINLPAYGLCKLHQCARFQQGKPCIDVARQSKGRGKSLCDRHWSSDRKIATGPSKPAPRIPYSIYIFESDNTPAVLPIGGRVFTFRDQSRNARQFTMSLPDEDKIPCATHIGTVLQRWLRDVAKTLDAGKQKMVKIVTDESWEACM